MRTYLIVSQNLNFLSIPNQGFQPPQNLSGWGTRPELAAAGGARKLPKKLAGESNRA